MQQGSWNPKNRVHEGGERASDTRISSAFIGLGVVLRTSDDLKVKHVCVCVCVCVCILVVVNDHADTESKKRSGTERYLCLL